MGKKNGIVTVADERDLALGLLAGLHPCITIDGPPMTVAERIFDAVMADQAGLKAQLKQAQHTIELLQDHLGQLRRSQPATTLSNQ